MKTAAERSRSSQQSIPIATTIVKDAPSSNAAGIQYFKLRRKLRQQRPVLLDPRLIPRRGPEIRPPGAKRRRQVSATVTTTTEFRSTTTILVSPSSTETEVIVVVPVQISVIPPVITTITESNGVPTVVTITPPVTVTLPASTVTLGPPGSSPTEDLPGSAGIGSGSTSSTARSTPLSPGSPNNTSFPGSSTTPQTRLSSNRLAVIVGSTIGSAIALILLIVLIFFFCRRRNRRREAQPVLLPDPFPIETREPVSVEQGGQFTSSPSQFGNIASGNITHSPKSTNQSSSKHGYVRQDTSRSQSTGIQSGEIIRPLEGTVSTPSPPPMSLDSTASELQALRQRMQEIESLARRFRETDAMGSIVQPAQVERPSESPPEYASPVEAGNSG
ncbi:hypothetical protein GALMADRAFT_151410 [Galerina marginata CBS 339.88]|uniref:Mid2 domain-containing protein n=1 Tax=Galerina marginata (strain CBS 339.88) TaxID=685588 RepID=A0A067TN24_GALM3|nr:hypothetical protein GALMADRAFT_151410 [Galerina marginata CBS 339.88]